MRDYWQKSYNIDVNSPVIGVIEPKLVSKSNRRLFLPFICQTKQLAEERLHCLLKPLPGQVSMYPLFAACLKLDLTYRTEESAKHDARAPNATTSASFALMIAFHTAISLVLQANTTLRRSF